MVALDMDSVVDEVLFLTVNGVGELEEGSEDEDEGHSLLLRHPKFLNRCMYDCLYVAGAHAVVLFIC